VAHLAPVVQEAGRELSVVCALVSLLQLPLFVSRNLTLPLPLLKIAIQ